MQCSVRTISLLFFTVPFTLITVQLLLELLITSILTRHLEFLKNTAEIYSYLPSRVLLVELLVAVFVHLKTHLGHTPPSW